MTDIYDNFPFDELRATTGDYYESTHDAIKAGFVPTQIWSVIESKCGNHRWVVHGPFTRVVGVQGYIATTERHDDNTYYHSVNEVEES